MATVSLKNISMAASGSVVVENLNLEVLDREFLVLAGPSDSGASALLGVIAGLESASSGEILIGDRPVQTLPPEDRDVALVFGAGALFPHLNIRENLAYGLKARSVLKAEVVKRVREAAAILGIEALLESSPSDLSATERLRVAIGRAIVRQPKVLLLDNPLAQLAASERAEMRGELIRLHERLQATMIYATADPVEAMTLGGRIAVMNHGGIEQIDTPVSLYQRPSNRFVAEYLGNPPMNFIRGKLRVGAAGVTFKEIGDGTIELKIENRPELQPYNGQEVELGVRPEDLVFVPAVGKPQGMRFQGLVDLIEPRGGETLFHVETGAHRLISRSQGGVDRHEAGRRLLFEIALANAHFFDPATSRRIE